MKDPLVDNRRLEDYSDIELVEYAQHFCRNEANRAFARPMVVNAFLTLEKDFQDHTFSINKVAISILTGKKLTSDDRWCGICEEDYPCSESVYRAKKILFGGF